MCTTRLRAILIFSDFSGDPLDITSALGVRPDYVTKVGERGKYGHIGKRNAWNISTPERYCANLNELVDELTARLSHNWDAVVKHARQSQVELLCEIWVKSGSVDSVIGVSAANVQRLAELGATFGFDHYLYESESERD